MRDGSESMEQHGRKLNYQNKGKEEHKYQTNRFRRTNLLIKPCSPIH